MTPLTLAVFMLHPIGLLSLATALLCFGTLFIPIGAFTQDAVNKLLAGDFVTIAASGAINPHVAARYMITKAGVAAMTLAAPTKTLEDGLRMEILSNTANAHTITATGLYADGAGHVNLATFAAQIGARLELEAFQGKWFVRSAQGVTMS
jgi:hypothetical protein